jgi:hypothetical protein
MNPYESFYHGLVTSKLWLCEELEKCSYIKPNIKILGSWHNLMAFMLIVRKPNSYHKIDGYDIDQDAIVVANQICNTWLEMEEPNVTNHVADVSKLDFSNDTNTVYINCSIDQFTDTSWYNTIPAGSLVCMQTTTLPTSHEYWEIQQETKSMEDLLNKYNLGQVYYTGERQIPFRDTSYTRLMAIGTKK